MVSSRVEPEREHTLRCTSTVKDCPIIMDVIHHKTLFPIECRIQVVEIQIGQKVFEHTIRFYPPQDCTIVDYFIYGMSFKDKVSMPVPHKAIPDAYLNKN